MNELGLTKMNPVFVLKPYKTLSHPNACKSNNVTPREVGIA